MNITELVNSVAFDMARLYAGEITFERFSNDYQRAVSEYRGYKNGSGTYHTFISQLVQTELSSTTSKYIREHGLSEEEIMRRTSHLVATAGFPNLTVGIPRNYVLDLDEKVETALITLKEAVETLERKIAATVRRYMGLTLDYKAA
jgi:hypothetical protein